jgi:hypothetical protein
MTTGSGKTLKDLTDLQIVNPTIANARRAIETDPTAWSSVMALVIMATNDPIEIKGDEEVGDEPAADAKAVNYIKNKVREWNLNSLRVTTEWKNLVDGRGFVETYISPDKPTIQEVTHLAFDENDYDFIDIVDPYTNELLGYKQKATIYPVPSGWESKKFDEIKNRQPETKETTFTKNLGYIPVFMSKMFVGDGNSEGFVFKALDDIYCLKELKNIMPDAARMATMTVGVTVGNKDFPFKPYNDTDTLEQRISKMEARMKIIGDNFKQKYDKEAILMDGGMDVQMIGDGKLPDFPSFNNFYKQEIREALLTPDSRFNASQSSYAASKEQLSGSAGQSTVVNYVANNCHNDYEKYIFDLELSLAKYQNDVGKIHIYVGEQETQDEKDLATIGQSILQYRPDISELVIDQYYPRLAKVYDSKKNTAPDLKPPVTNSMGGAIKDPQTPNILAIVEATKIILTENGELV